MHMEQCRHACQLAQRGCTSLPRSGHHGRWGKATCFDGTAPRFFHQGTNNLQTEESGVDIQKPREAPDVASVHFQGSQLAFPLSWKMPEERKMFRKGEAANHMGNDVGGRTATVR